MRLILPALALVLLTACGLKDDLYLPETETSPPAAADADGARTGTEHHEDEDDHEANP
jgi:predicted small lipoprotein YifL